MKRNECSMTMWERKAARFLWGALLLLCFFLLALPVGAESEPTVAAEPVPSGTEEETQGGQNPTDGGEEQWKKLLSEKVIPITVFGITAIGSVYVAIAPVLNRMKSAAGNMDVAAGGVKESAEASRTATARVEAFREEAVRLRQEMEALIEGNQSKLTEIARGLEEKLSIYAESIEELRTETDKVEEMLAVGLGNTDELVRKGYAKVLFALWTGETADVAVSGEDVNDEA